MALVNTARVENTAVEPVVPVTVQVVLERVSMLFTTYGAAAPSLKLVRAEVPPANEQRAVTVPPPAA